MPRALLITNPAAARTRPTAVGHHHARRCGRRGGAPRCWPPAGRATHAGSRSTGWRSRWTSWPCSAGTAPRCRRPRRSWAPTWRSGVIPGGTGNLLAGNLRIPAAPARAARRARDRTAKRFDLGRMDRPAGAQYFAVACGAGYDARVMSETCRSTSAAGAWRRTSRRRSGSSARCGAAAHVITIDGVEWEANAAMVLVANCGEVIPPFIRLGPASVPTTACSTSSSCGPTASGRACGPSGICSGCPGPPAGEDTFVGYARGREIRVESTPTQPVQLDGEPGGLTPFSVSACPCGDRHHGPLAD